MIRKLNLEDQKAVQDILNVQIPAYQIEAEIIGFDGIPGLRDTIETIRQSGETFNGYYLQQKLAGVISFERENHTVTICRLMVHPDFFRRGIASALLDFLLTHEIGVSKYVVSTDSGNLPAITLYQRYGFADVAQKEVSPGVFLTFLQKQDNRT